jgi:hypothetical protein
MISLNFVVDVLNFNFLIFQNSVNSKSEKSAKICRVTGETGVDYVAIVNPP